MAGSGGVSLGGLTREQKMLGAAAANVLFIISMFFSWFGASAAGISISFSGTDIVPSWWILAIVAALAAVVLASEALYIELPARFDTLTGVWLSVIPFLFTLMIMLEGGGLGAGGGRKFGIFLALIFSAVATVLAFISWREDPSAG